MENHDPPKGSGKKPPDDGEVGYYPYFTTKNGKRIWAKDYGHKGWPIPRRKSKK